MASRLGQRNYLSSVRLIANVPFACHSNPVQPAKDDSHSLLNSFNRREIIDDNNHINQSMILNKEHSAKYDYLERVTRSFIAQIVTKLKQHSDALTSEHPVLDEWILEYLTKLDNQKETTIIQYIFRLKSISEGLGLFRLDKITDQHIADYLNQQAHSQAISLRCSLNLLFKHAVLAGKLKVNPIKAPQSNQLRKSAGKLKIDALITMRKMTESGIKPNQVCKEINISIRTFYNWKKDYDNLDLHELHRLKEIIASNPLNKGILPKNKNKELGLLMYYQNMKRRADLETRTIILQKLATLPVSDLFHLLVHYSTLEAVGQPTANSQTSLPGLSLPNPPY